MGEVKDGNPPGSGRHEVLPSHEAISVTAKAIQGDVGVAGQARDAAHLAVAALMNRPDLLVRLAVEAGALVGVGQVGRKKNEFFYMCEDGWVRPTENTTAFVTPRHFGEGRTDG